MASLRAVCSSRVRRVGMWSASTVRGFAARVLVAALLVPTLLLAMPGVSSASSTWVLGTQTGTNIAGWEVHDYGIPEPSCAVRAKWSGYTGIGDVGATLQVEGICEWLWTPHVTSVEFTGSAGTGCSITLPVSSEETSGWYDASDETRFEGSIDTFTGCEVDHYTLFIPKDNLPDAEVYGTIPLGDASEPVVASGDCAVDVYEIFSERRLTGDVWEYRHGFGVLSDEPRTVEADYNFSIYNGQGGRNLDAHGGQTGPGLLEWDLDSGAQVVYTPWHSWGNGPFSPDPSAWSGPTGIYEAISDPTVSFGTPIVFSMWEQGSSSWANTYLGTGSDGLAPDVPPSGATAQVAQGMCSWWITEEGSVTPSDGPGDSPLPEDELLPEDAGGTGGDEPLESGCAFSLSDPTTWASGGICALVYLAKKMVNLLRQILAAIANGVGGVVGLAWDGLEAVAIPTDFEGPATDMQDAWSGTGWGAWADVTTGNLSMFSTLGSESPGSGGGASGGGGFTASSGCAGPALTVDLPGMGETTIHPMSACGPMADAAAIVKAFLTLVMIVGTSVACFNSIGEAFGYRINYRAAAWGGPNAR